MTKDMLSYCKKLVEEIKALVYLQPEKRDIDSLTEMERIQVRAADDPEHTKNISNRITDEGSTDDCDPVVVIIVDGVEKLLDGNHTTQATDLAQIDDKSLQWQLIPSEITDQLGESELLWIGNALNPRKKKEEKSNNHDDCVKLVLSMLNDGHSTNDDEVTDAIKELGHVGSEITSIKKKANNRFAKLISVKEGHVWKNFKTVKKYRDELKKLLRELSTDTNEVYETSSGNFKLEKMTGIAWNWSKRIDSGAKQIKKEIVAVVYHPDAVTQEKWNNEEKNRRLPEFTYVLHKMNGIKLTVIELNPWAPDGASKTKCSCCNSQFKDISEII